MMKETIAARRSNITWSPLRDTYNTPSPFYINILQLNNLVFVMAAPTVEPHGFGPHNFSGTASVSAPAPKHPSQPPDIARSAAAVDVTMCSRPDAEATGNTTIASSSTVQMSLVTGHTIADNFQGAGSVTPQNVWTQFGAPATCPARPPPFA